MRCASLPVMAYYYPHPQIQQPKAHGRPDWALRQDKQHAPAPVYYAPVHPPYYPYPPHKRESDSASSASAWPSGWDWWTAGDSEDGDYSMTPVPPQYWVHYGKAAHCSPGQNSITAGNSQSMSEPAKCDATDPGAAENAAQELRPGGDDETNTTQPETRISSNLEKCTLAALTRIYPGKSFQKTRPPWLRNPQTGRACELDFYNQELRLGVEVQVYRDRLKERLCKEEGVTLVHVPFTVQRKDVEDYIRKEICRVAESTMNVRRSKE